MLWGNKSLTQHQTCAVLIGGSMGLLQYLDPVQARLGLLINLNGGSIGADPLMAIPAGYGPDIAILPAVTGGAMSSFGTASVGINARGSGALGRDISGFAEIRIDARGAGGLVVDLKGSAVIAIEARGAMVAIITGSGRATVAIDARAAIDAIGWAVAQAVIGLEARGQALGIGHMSGSTEGGGVMDEKSIAAEVWQSVASGFNAPGTMGEKLNGAGAAGDPWTGEIEGGETARETMRLFRAVLLGKTTVTVNGDGTATVVFLAKDGTTHRVTAEMTGKVRTQITTEAT
jgi:hypothetical protein